MRPAGPSVGADLPDRRLLILGIANVISPIWRRRGDAPRPRVGIRKVVGARRSQLIAQFIAESCLVAFIGMVIALAIAELLLPAFAAFVDAPLKIDYFGTGGIALPVLLLTAFVGLIGGAYPAFHLSAFRPDRVLKSAAAPGGGTDRIRQLLVVGQFAISIALIISTW